jgi:16S rRNA (guanine966-N2)-methyltransferase
MRIIAGELKGLHFESPKNHKTHPMSDKMRGALFNMLGDLEDLSVYDAFGGSGALSFEAISRGAKKALVTEIDKHAWSVIKQNIDKLGLEEQIKAVRANASGWSENNYTTQFDIVLCDPPYLAVKQNQLTQLTRNVKPEGLMVLSLPSKMTLPKFEDMNLERDSNYGDGSLAFYRKVANEK